MEEKIDVGIADEQNNKVKKEEKTEDKEEEAVDSDSDWLEQQSNNSDIYSVHL